MAIVVIMPKQGQSVEVVSLKVNKKKGDTEKGDVLFSYETDKASFEEESPVDKSYSNVLPGRRRSSRIGKHDDYW